VKERIEKKGTYFDLNYVCGRKCQKEVDNGTYLTDDGWTVTVPFQIFLLYFYYLYKNKKPAYIINKRYFV